MSHLDEARDGESPSDIPFGDEFAAQLATLVFEWRPARMTRFVSPRASGLWMSRSARRAERTPA